MVQLIFIIFYFSHFQGDYIWIEPVSKREFDVAIGARVISAEGRKIQVRRNVFFFFFKVDDLFSQNRIIHIGFGNSNAFSHKIVFIIPNLFGLRTVKRKTTSK